MEMFGDDDRSVARKAVLDAKFHRIAPNDEELEQALKSPSDQVATAHVLLIGELHEVTLTCLPGAVTERPALATSILPRLGKRLGDSRVRKVFLEALSSELVSVRACAYRTVVTDVHSAADDPELRTARLDTLGDLEEVLGSTLRLQAGLNDAGGGGAVGLGGKG